MITLDDLNTLSVEAFTATLGSIFEHSPWVAQRAAASRPFASRLDLLDAMRAVVRDAPLTDQLNLIRAHPQLGARGRKRLELTEASSHEQRRAGLDACSDEEFAELMRLNAEYVEKFDFPFILAVRGHDPESILAFMRRRLNNSPEDERHTALTQIGLIGGYRLADLVSSSAAAEVLAMQARSSADTSSTTTAAASSRPSTSATPIASLLREWMLAVGMDVRAGFGLAPRSVSGSAPSAAVAKAPAVGAIGSAPPATGANAIAHTAAGSTPSTPSADFLFGAYFDSTSGTLQRDGSLSTLLGIALAQALRLRQQPSRFGLLVFPYPDDHRPGSILVEASQGALREHTELSATEFDSLATVRAAGLTGHCVVVSSPAPARGSAPLDLDTLERTVSALETFLTLGPV